MKLNDVPVSSVFYDGFVDFYGHDVPSFLKLQFELVGGFANHHARLAIGGATQGVFLGDEAMVGYERVQIVANTITGAQPNGIGVGNVASGLVVTGNTVTAMPPEPSSINIVRSPGLTVENNLGTVNITP